MWGLPKSVDFIKICLFLLLSISWSLTAHSAPAYRIFEDCDPTGIELGINNFTICGFKASSQINIDTVDEVYSRYISVSDKLYLIYTSH
jgi:hypothetical protein